jgi:hypothetical protein
MLRICHSATRTAAKRFGRAEKRRSPQTKAVACLILRVQSYGLQAAFPFFTKNLAFEWLLQPLPLLYCRAYHRRGPTPALRYWSLPSRI